MSLWFQFKSSRLKIDIKRLQCLSATETGQIQKVVCYLPFCLVLSVFGLKTKDLYHVVLPGGWNHSQDLNELFQQALRQQR